MAPKKKAVKKVAKKKEAKKVVEKAVKKAVKKVIKKAVKKNPNAEEKSVPLSRFCCQQIADGQSNEQIAKMLVDKYPKLKNTDEKAVEYYKKKILDGKFEKYGYPPSIVK